eukprot:TRINITY_DN2250_c0_g1_i1.p2 TRINITY_DN2250_c0_g1~~TRINITY_DN2250_c0_g1_i1.p2  ORF type:complete len:105 (+),score=30.12 TRINITY_DN2250_c0_g1_i1:27-317(+)
MATFSGWTANVPAAYQGTYSLGNGGGATGSFTGNTFTCNQWAPNTWSVGCNSTGNQCVATAQGDAPKIFDLQTVNGVFTATQIETKNSGAGAWIKK